MNVFEEIYRKREWGNGSGAGSDPRATTGYREFLQRFVVENDIETVVDYGCGDWQFSRYVDWRKAQYLGLDVVPGLIARNSKQFGSDRVRFTLAPDDPTDLPEADLLIAKDVLQHLPNDEVAAFLNHASEAYRFTLITNCVWPKDELNRDIAKGDWRPLDVRVAPFSAAATAVYAFCPPVSLSLRARKRQPPWKKVVLLLG
ncbi:MAG: class I SAM-dependent methyltransferase [Solirubrobacterales bacterium]|nr:class I SAM-dependent methyltransferase [Solirubrobacterales bacterium]MBV9808701.1 class I SAM-dependent methyltransferase [Solirubrobacterales bacterium]